MHDKVLDDLVRDEGEVLHAYKDSLGYLTIGVGRLIDERRGGGITHDEAMHLLRNDVAKVIGELDAALPWWRLLDEDRQRVLINMAFNLGINGLKKFTRTLASIKRGDYATAAAEMLDSKWATQVGARAVRLSNLMRFGKDAGNGR